MRAHVFNFDSLISSSLLLFVTEAANFYFFEKTVTKQLMLRLNTANTLHCKRMTSPNNLNNW